MPLIPINLDSISTNDLIDELLSRDLVVIDFKQKSIYINDILMPAKDDLTLWDIKKEMGK